MIKLLRQDAQERISNHVRSRYEKIKPIATQGVFNFRCFDNSVEFARLHPGIEVVEVIYIDCDEPVLHYLNYCPNTGNYLETTLGFYADTDIEYFLIRKIHPSLHKRIWAEFDETRKTWNKEWVCKLARMIGVKVL
jgi:hypothetical protein